MYIIRATRNILLRFDTGYNVRSSDRYVVGFERVERKLFIRTTKRNEHTEY